LSYAVDLNVCFFDDAKFLFFLYTHNSKIMVKAYHKQGISTQNEYYNFTVGKLEKIEE